MCGVPFANVQNEFPPSYKFCPEAPHFFEFLHYFEQVLKLEWL